MSNLVCLCSGRTILRKCIFMQRTRNCKWGFPAPVLAILWIRVTCLPHAKANITHPARSPQPAALSPTIAQPQAVQMQPTVVSPTIVQPSVVPPTIVQPTVVPPMVVQPYLVQPTVMQPATTTVVVQQTQYKPNNYMCIACLTFFFCSPLFGFVAWIFSCCSDCSYGNGEL